jgi:hypothetical protein
MDHARAHVRGPWRRGRRRSCCCVVCAGARAVPQVHQLHCNLQCTAAPVSIRQTRHAGRPSSACRLSSRLPGAVTAASRCSTAAARQSAPVTGRPTQHQRAAATATATHHMRLRARNLRTGPACHRYKRSTACASGIYVQERPEKGVSVLTNYCKAASLALVADRPFRLVHHMYVRGPQFGLQAAEC